MNEVSETPPLWVIILAVVLVLIQGTWLFLDARKRGLGKWSWFWGIWGSTTVPMPLLLYWFIVIRKNRRKS